MNSRIELPGNEANSLDCRVRRRFKFMSPRVIESTESSVVAAKLSEVPGQHRKDLQVRKQAWNSGAHGWGRAESFFRRMHSSGMHRSISPRHETDLVGLSQRAVQPEGEERWVVHRRAHWKSSR